RLRRPSTGAPTRPRRTARNDDRSRPPWIRAAALLRRRIPPRRNRSTGRTISATARRTSGTRRPVFVSSPWGLEILPGLVIHPFYSRSDAAEDLVRDGPDL